MEQLQLQHMDKFAENTSIDETDVVEELNKEEVERLIPVFIYLALISIAGLIGNGLVCYVYRSKYNLSSSRWFIFFLSVVDLILCAVNIPLEIGTTALQYNFTNRLLCKTTVFANLWSLLSLGFTLFIVSIDRYKKVCRPLGWQINYYKSRLLSAGAVVLGFLISLPVWEVYDIYSFEIYPVNVTVHECSFRKSVATSNFAFGCVLFGMIVFSSTLTVICVMYLFIGKNIRQHTLKENKRLSLMASVVRKHHIRPTLSVTSNHYTNTHIVRPVKSVKFREPKVIEQEPAIEEATNSNTPSTEVEESANLSDEDTTEIEMAVVPIRSCGTEKTKSRRMRRARARKATFSMFLISIAFVLSYLPFLCLLLARSLDSGFDESLTDEGRAVYKFFLRSYFLNCAINPFMYGISDTKFRESVKEVLNSFCYRLHNLPSLFSQTSP